MENGYISPQFLFNLGNTGVMPDALDNQFHTALPSKPIPGVKAKDVGTLQPGMQYQLSHDLIPTPQSILDGSYVKAIENLSKHRDVVIIVPRLSKYCGSPSLPSITFSVNGQLGPYVLDLVQDRVVVDQAFNLIFRDRLWKQTSLTIDWPGVNMPAEYIPCVDKDNHDLTRMQFAKLVALRVHNLITTGKDGKSFKWGHQVIDKETKVWNLKKMDYERVRLVAMNYYRRTWTPVLAVDVHAHED